MLLDHVPRPPDLPGPTGAAADHGPHGAENAGPTPPLPASERSPAGPPTDLPDDEFDDEADDFSWDDADVDDEDDEWDGWDDDALWRRLDREIAERRRDLVIVDDPPRPADEGPGPADVPDERFIFTPVRGGDTVGRSRCSW